MCYRHIRAMICHLYLTILFEAQTRGFVKAIDVVFFLELKQGNRRRAFSPSEAIEDAVPSKLIHPKEKLRSIHNVMQRLHSPEHTNYKRTEHVDNSVVR